ncbi:MAG: hypothetical protein ACK56I_16355, partial [bacterium]
AVTVERLLHGRGQGVGDRHVHRRLRLSAGRRHEPHPQPRRPPVRDREFHAVGGDRPRLVHEDRAVRLVNHRGRVGLGTYRPPLRPRIGRRADDRDRAVPCLWFATPPLHADRHRPRILPGHGSHGTADGQVAGPPHSGGAQPDQQNRRERTKTATGIY